MDKNQEWLNRLLGFYGNDAQGKALDALFKHLYKVAFTKLKKVRFRTVLLKELNDAAFSDLAEDFAQDTIEKLMRDNGALLEQFESRGTFLGWSSKIVLNIISSELRRPYWSRRNAMSEGEFKQQIAQSHQPENRALITEVFDAVQDCLAHMTERRRDVFQRTVIEQQPVDKVAEELGATTNAIHIMNYRTRERLRQCMRQKGFDDDMLNMF